ncbi:16840_t:CDS:2, partial [Cetraspora pellucida]
ILLSGIFAQIITIDARSHKPHHSKCSKCCEAPSSTGWTNLVHIGGNAIFTSDTSAQSCCESCVADPNCAQWAFKASCQHNVPPSTCVASSLTPYNDSGPLTSDNSNGLVFGEQ